MVSTSCGKLPPKLWITWELPLEKCRSAVDKSEGKGLLERSEIPNAVHPPNNRAARGAFQLFRTLLKRLAAADETAPEVRVELGRARFAALGAKEDARRDRQAGSRALKGIVERNKH